MHRSQTGGFQLTGRIIKVQGCPDLLLRGQLFYDLFLVFLFHRPALAPSGAESVEGMDSARDKDCTVSKKLQWNNPGHGVEIAVAVKEEQAVFEGRLGYQAVDRASYGNPLFAAGHIKPGGVDK